MTAHGITGSPAGRYGLLRTYHRPLLWTALACLFGLDIITTTVSLDLGYLEKNPVMVPFASDPLLHGLVKIGAYLLLFFAVELGVAFIRTQRPEEKPFPVRFNYACLYGVILAAIFSLLWLYTRVVVHNIRVIAAAAGAG